MTEADRIARAVETAQALAAAGFGIVEVYAPTEDGCACSAGRTCPDPGKHPIGSEWQNWATRSPHTIAQIVGRHGQYGVIPWPGGRGLIADIDRLAELPVKLPETFLVASSPGKSHVYYRVPEGFDPASLPATAPWGEVRVEGAPRHVVGPWSRHAGGTIYQPRGGVEDIAEIPASVLDQLFPPHASSLALGNGHGGYHLPEPGYLGSRYDAIRDYVASRYARGLSTDEIWTGVLDVLSPRFAEPLSVPDLKSRFERAMKGTAERIGRADWTDGSGSKPADADRPHLAPVAEMTHTPAFGRDLVSGLIPRGSVSVWASVEGLGKSGMRAELGIRGATGCGPLFGYFPIPAPFRVATFDEENGHDEELRRDDETLAALGLERDALGDRYQRASFAGLFLNAAADRAYLDAEMERTRPDLLILDTAGSMVADEWGPPLKETIRYLRSLSVRFGVAMLLIVHMTKPARDGKRPELHGTKIGDVMGQWTRSVDVVGLMADLGEGRVRLALTKKITPIVLVLQRDSGLWRWLNTGESKPARDRNDDRILRAIVGGLTTAEDIREQLGTAGRLMPERTFYDALKRLRGDGLVTAGTPLSATDGGLEAIP